MKKAIKKIVALGMVAAMAFPLAACGNGDGGNTSSSAGVIRPSKTSVQVIIGTKVQFVADEFKKLAKNK